MLITAMIKIISLIAALFLTSVEAAEITKLKYNSILIEGEIVKGDLKKIKSIIDTHLNVESILNIQDDDKSPKVAGTVLIKSKGGDVLEAMRIGRLIRESEYGVMPGICASSCVYMLAAGVTRTVILSPGHVAVGIHRPYISTTETNDVDRTIKEILQKSREYFQEMNINPKLAEDMFSIPPESVKYLSEHELTEYRLNQTDITFQERIDLYEAKIFGMSRVDFLEAKAKYKKDKQRYCEPEFYRSHAAAINDDERHQAVLALNECMKNFAYKHGLFEKPAK